MMLCNQQFYVSVNVRKVKQRNKTKLALVIYQSSAINDHACMYSM